MKSRVAAALLVLFGLSAGSLFAQKYEVDPYAGGFFPTSSESVGRFRNEGMYGLRGGRFIGDHFEFGGNFDYLTHFDLKQNNPTMVTLDNAGIFRPSVHAIEYGAMLRYNFTGPHWFGPRVTPYVTGGVGALTAMVKSLSNSANASNAALIAQANANNGTTNSASGFNNSSVFLGGNTANNTAANSNNTTTNPFGPSSTSTTSANPFGAGTTTMGSTATTTTTAGSNPFGVNNSATSNVTSMASAGFVLNDGDTFLTLTYGFGIKALNLWGPMGLHLDVAGHTMPNFFGHQMSWPQATGGLTFTWGER